MISRKLLLVPVGVALALGMQGCDVPVDIPGVEVFHDFHEVKILSEAIANDWETSFLQKGVRALVSDDFAPGQCNWYLYTSVDDSPVLAGSGCPEGVSEATGETFSIDAIALTFHDEELLVQFRDVDRSAFTPEEGRQAVGTFINHVFDRYTDFRDNQKTAELNADKNRASWQTEDREP